jgi:hypothetical protein
MMSYTTFILALGAAILVLNIPYELSREEVRHLKARIADSRGEMGFLKAKLRKNPQCKEVLRKIDEGEL